MRNLRKNARFLQSNAQETWLPRRPFVYSRYNIKKVMKNVNTLYQLQKDLLKQVVDGDITTKQFNACMDSELISTHKETGISKEMIVYRLLQMDPKSKHYKR